MFFRGKFSLKYSNKINICIKVLYAVASQPTSLSSGIRTGSPGEIPDESLEGSLGKLKK